MRQADCDPCDEQVTKLQEQIAAKDAELTRWQEIAKDRTAQIGWMTSCNCGRPPNTLKWDYCNWSRDIPQSVRDGWCAWAAKELGIQISQEDDGNELTIAYMLGSQKANARLRVLQAYTRRLEADYMFWVREYYRDLGEYEAITRAQAALEKIRHDTNHN